MLVRALFDTTQPIPIIEYILNFAARVGCGPKQRLVIFECVFNLCGLHVTGDLKDYWLLALYGEYQIRVRKVNSLHEFLLDCFRCAAEGFPAARSGSARARHFLKILTRTGSARATGRSGLAVVYREGIECLKLLLCQLHVFCVKLQIGLLEPIVRVLYHFRAFLFRLAKLCFQMQYFLCVG